MTVLQPKTALVVGTRHHADEVCRTLGINPATRYDETWRVIIAGENMNGMRFETIIVSESVERNAQAAAEYHVNLAPRAWLAELGLRLAAGGRLVYL